MSPIVGGLALTSRDWVARPGGGYFPVLAVGRPELVHWSISSTSSRAADAVTLIVYCATCFGTVLGCIPAPWELLIPFHIDEAVKCAGRLRVECLIQSQAVSDRTRPGSDSSSPRYASTASIFSSMLPYVLPSTHLRTSLRNVLLQSRKTRFRNSRVRGVLFSSVSRSRFENTLKILTKFMKSASVGQGTGSGWTCSSSHERSSANRNELVSKSRMKWS